MITKTQQIYEHLNEFGFITYPMSRELYKIKGLALVITHLRKAGYYIERRFEIDPRSGHNWPVYYLVGTQLKLGENIC